MKTLGAVKSHLAKSTFCWLPPESVLTLAVGPFARTSTRSMTDTAAFRSPRLPTTLSRLDLAEMRQRDVVDDRAQHQQALRLPVLGQQRDAATNGGARRAEANAVVPRPGSRRLRHDPHRRSRARPRSGRCRSGRPGRGSRRRGCPTRRPGPPADARARVRRARRARPRAAAPSPERPAPSTARAWPTRAARGSPRPPARSARPCRREAR